MTSIDPTIKQKLINRLSNDYVDVEPLTTKKFEQDHFDAPTLFLMVVAVAQGLILIKDSVESIEWLIDQIRRIAKKDSEKSSEFLDERERVLAALAKHQVARGQGLTLEGIAASTSLPHAYVLAILEELAELQVVGESDDLWSIYVEDLCG